MSHDKRLLIHGGTLLANWSEAEIHVVNSIRW
jgi:hypothetical protein